MTTIYIPLLIESAEQAEALPEGTVVINTRAGAIEKGSRGRWWSGLNQVPDRTPIGASALVPVEAEEETSGYIMYGGRGQETFTGTRTRLVTPWEETP